MREHCVHLSNISARMGVLFSCSKGSEVKEKHFRVEVHKMPSLNHTEWLWKLCAGHHPQQNQMTPGAAAALPAQLGTSGTGATIWRMAGFRLAEFLVTWAPESLPVAEYWYPGDYLLPRMMERGTGMRGCWGALPLWPSTTRFWQSSPWGIKILGLGCFPALPLERCSEQTVEKE